MHVEFKVLPRLNREEAGARLLIAHMSDVHLGARKYGEKAIYDDVFRAFEESLEAVAREHAEALVLAGDVFDSPHPD
ncbi:MAG: hypothetical protein RXQ79_07480, partial [Acidilobus sp.]